MFFKLLYKQICFNKKKMKQTNNRNIFQFFIHIIAWGIIFGLPFIIFGKDTDFNVWDKMLHHAVVVLSMAMVFYINYFLLIEKVLFKRKIGKFFWYNLFLILVLGATVHFWQESTMQLPLHGKIPPPEVFHNPWFFLIRDIITLLVISTLSIAVKMTAKWYTSEVDRQEEEKKRTEAELKNLRQQLNPHFLFNTFNNIYALIGISPDKAQEAMLELSKLLRYVLYDNSSEHVLLKHELDFIINYVELMRIRLTDDVDIKLDINISENNTSEIAPMLFISLIENAFKHGISPNQKSFIHINFGLIDNNKLTCTINNSYFPKDQHDMTGSGIGLENLRRRLELLYPENHEFQTGELNGIYYSHIVIPLNSNLKL
jgi:two-component sensor histidine kinase